MSELMWRFPGNNYTNESGLDTAEMETFKKDPIASLAREICQNSIDARISKDKPVIVEFSKFEINKDDIPSINRIEKELQSCSVSNNDIPKILGQLKTMRGSLLEEKIVCLRASDFNTKGLQGVNSTDKTPWYLLTKGSGLSNKGGTSGGSKGIGKFASFVTSKFNTVFYATRTVDGEQGFQGICKLCSTTMEGTDEKTQGIGYYGVDNKNNPILEYKSLDSNFNRTEEESGTDVFIMGFKDGKHWEREVISKILDSFIAAIHHGDLVIRINDIEISKDTLIDIINPAFGLIQKKDVNNITSQYHLLTDKDVYRNELSVGPYGDINIFIKQYGKESSHFASKKCVVIRYPYMKIKSMNVGPSLPYSAMCIIGDNKLNELLRESENPQHTDWHVKGMDDEELKQEVSAIIKQLKNIIQEELTLVLSKSDTESTDIEGASDYLPEEGNDESGSGEGKKETFKVFKPRKNKVKEKRALDEDESGEALTPDVGSVDVEGEGAILPTGENEGQGGSAHDNEDTGEPKEGDSDILKIVKMKGIRYRFMVINQSEKLYRIVFNSPYDEDNCEIAINYVDDVSQKHKIQILESYTDDNRKIELTKEKTIPIKLESGKKYAFIVKLDLDEMISSEVTIHAYR